MRLPAGSRTRRGNTGVARSGRLRVTIRPMRLTPGSPVNAFAATADHEPLPAERIRAGAPTTSWVELGHYAGCEIGVWEMTPGIATDVEEDEVFVVVAGRGRVEFIDPVLPAIDLRVGDIVRLSAGMNTIWTITETLRKIAIV